MTETNSKKVIAQLLRDFPESGAELLKSNHNFSVPENAARVRSMSEEEMAECRPPGIENDAVLVFEDEEGKPLQAVIVVAEG